jgi:hypothetical protein
MDFTDKLRLRGKAEEDIYFARIDQQLIKAMHEKEALEDGKNQKQVENEQQPPATMSK